jgi:hypothetical protein
MPYQAGFGGWRPVIGESGSYGPSFTCKQLTRPEIDAQGLGTQPWICPKTGHFPQSKGDSGPLASPAYPAQVVSKPNSLAAVPPRILA